MLVLLDFQCLNQRSGEKKVPISYLTTSVRLTYVVPGGQILVFTAGVSLFPVQQEVVDHFLLVLPVERDTDRPIEDSMRRHVQDRCERKIQLHPAPNHDELL